MAPLARAPFVGIPHHTTLRSNGRAHIVDGRPRWVYFTNDENGQVIRRDESDGNGSLGDPHEVWYRFGGRQLGFTGNNGTSDVDYTLSITMRQSVPTTTPGIPGTVYIIDVCLASS